MHTITLDMSAGIIEVTVSGFWTEAHVADFGRDLHDAGVRMSMTGKPHSLLCDYTNAAIQSQTVVAALQAMVMNAKIKSRRVALFTSGQLARQQARRVATVRDTMAVFDDRASALDWLKGDEIEEYARAAG